MREPRGAKRSWAQPTLLASGLMLVFAGAIPAAAGPSGSKACAECHEEVVDAFATTAHGREGWSHSGLAAGCEDCHGPGRAHIRSDGDVDKILNPASAPAHEAADACLACHGAKVARHWSASEHEAAGLGCADCHKVHASWTHHPADSNRKITHTCLGCHSDMQKHLHQRSSHPLEEGLMSCTSCHDPHGSTAPGAVAAVTTNDKCYECHADKRGPFLFEHAPVREDCSVCHDPHGSNQTALLTTSAPRLCQSCHLFGHHQTVPGQPRQVWNQNRSCVNCHPRIHGSNHPSGVIFMR